MVLSKEDTTKLGELYRKHHQSVFRTCLRFAAGDRSWAMDRTQDVFVKLANKLPELHDPDGLGGWLYRVAANECLAHLRKQQGWRRVTETLVCAVTRAAPSAERDIRARRDITDLEQAISALPPHQQAVMVLVYLDNKSQTEAAEILGLHKGYVSKLHKRALEALERHEWELHGE